jgi:hypothetical protein
LPTWTTTAMTTTTKRRKEVEEICAALENRVLC